MRSPWLRNTERLVRPLILVPPSIKVDPSRDSSAATELVPRRQGRRTERWFFRNGHRAVAWAFLEWAITLLVEIEVLLSDPPSCTMPHDDGVARGIPKYDPKVGGIMSPPKPAGSSAVDVDNGEVVDSTDLSQRLGSNPAAVTVLLVDDEPLVRRSFQRGLTQAGMNVVAVASAASALEILRRGECFDVVVTDVMMPDMDGYLLADRVDQISPGLPVLLISGEVETPTLDRHLPRAVARRLCKPLELTTLSSAVREAASAGRNRSLVRPKTLDFSGYPQR